MDSLRHKYTPPAPPQKNLSFPEPKDGFSAANSLPRPSVSPLFDPPLPAPSQKKYPSFSVQKKKSRFQKYWFFLAGFFLLLILLFGALVWKGMNTAQRIQVTGNTESAPSLTQKLKTLQAAFLPGEQVPLRGTDRGRINILLLGKAGEGLPGSNLTDTLMLASIEMRTKKVALISLPRDLYVRDETTGTEGKINTFYQRGLNEDTPLYRIKSAVTLVTGEPVDYFFVLDFAGFESVVDALGGISVDVPKDFYDPRYPGANYSYELFELKKGWQRLDGKTALQYVRERHDDPEGDFGRAKRQQQVLQALKNKAYHPGTFLNFFRVNNLFESIAHNVETDATLPEMQSFYELSKTLDTQNITNQVIDAWKPESLLRVDHQMLGGVRAFALSPRTGTWEETQELAKNIFQLDVLNTRKAAIAKEEARVLILDSGETLASAEKLARYIEREFDIKTHVLYAPQLEQGSYPAMLVARDSLTKPYSFEELLKRLSLTKGNVLPSLPNTAPETDFILIMDERLAKVFQRADEYYNQDTILPTEISDEFHSAD